MDAIEKHAHVAYGIYRHNRRKQTKNRNKNKPV